MNTIKSIALAAICGAACTALGQYTSPELMLVTDSGGTLADGTVVAPRIERYDPYTGAYLGSFGTGYVHDPVGIAVVGQDAYVADPFTYAGTGFTRIDKFNFSTGAYDGSIFAGAPYNLYGLAKYGTYTLASDNGNGGNSEGVYTFDANGNETNFFAMPSGIFPESIAADGSHDYVATVSGGLFSYNLSASGVTTSLNFNATPAATLYGVAVNQGDVFTSGYANGTSDGVIYEYNTSGALLGEYSNGIASNGYYSLAFGHNGMLYAAGAGNVITRFDGDYNIEFGPLGSFSMSQTAEAERIAVYAAPEPASMFGLGLGAVALIARRRRRK